MRKTAVQELMESPVTIGGFTFMWGMVDTEMRKEGVSERCIAMYLLNPKYDPTAPDVRTLGYDAQVTVWDALGTGDLETINRFAKQIRSASHA